MARFARWHIWLGWLVGVPLLLWTLSGVAMVARPIEHVRGEHLRVKSTQPLPPGIPATVLNGLEPKPSVKEMRTFVQRGRPITLVTRLDGSVERFDAATGTRLGPLNVQEARAAVAGSIRGGSRISEVRAFPAKAPPLDLRKAVPTWQVTLEDGTRVYVNRDSGEVEAVRTRWWRFYDLMWGLHIMDLEGREDGHNPFTIIFGTLAILGSVLGSVLLFRRRKARPA